MQSLVEAEDARDITSREETTPDSSADLLLSGDDPSIDVRELQPDPIHVFRLWQLFLDRVNPLTKIIHTPTVQPYVIEGATNIRSLPLPQQALLFSIYTMAIFSLSDSECLEMFNFHRGDALRRFTQGAKLSLVRFDFLRNENLATLQALLLFLVGESYDLFSLTYVLWWMTSGAYCHG